MGVYIRGMEMPTSCLRGECPIAGEYCGLWEEKHWKSPDEPYRKRHPKCPIIPVPPHGRLIDADALDIYRREEQAQEDIEKSPFSEYLEGLKDGLHEAAKCLSTAPTIIEADCPPSIPLEQVWAEVFGEDGECKVCSNADNEYCFACDNGNQFKPITQEEEGE